ncbi:hypothetical protein D3C74_233940 [compost metagenome]
MDKRCCVQDAGKYDYMKVWGNLNEAILALQAAEEQIDYVDDTRKPLIRNHVDLLMDLRERFKNTFYDLQSRDDERAEQEG